MKKLFKKPFNLKTLTLNYTIKTCVKLIEIDVVINTILIKL